MKKISTLLVFAAMTLTGFAQPGQPPKDTTWKKIFRESAPIINNLVHTKLDVRFDFNKAYAMWSNGTKDAVNGALKANRTTSSRCRK